MLRTTDLSTIQYAPVDSFILPQQKLVQGDHLNLVKSLQDSLQRKGLLVPLTAAAVADKPMIIDGRKRLLALRRLAFHGQMPSALSVIPYVVGKASTSHARKTSKLTASPALYDTVREQREAGHDLDVIAADLHISRQCVRDLLSLNCLHPILRKAFFRQHIDFGQVKALTAIPVMDRQLALMRYLGPEACPETIFKAAQITARNMARNEDIAAKTPLSRTVSTSPYDQVAA